MAPGFTRPGESLQVRDLDLVFCLRTYSMKMVLIHGTKEERGFQV